MWCFHVAVSRPDSLSCLDRSPQTSSLTMSRVSAQSRYMLTMLSQIHMHRAADIGIMHVHELMSCCMVNLQAVNVS